MKLFNDDCMNILTKLENNSIDLIATDPPYGVNFKNDFYDDSLESIVKNMPLWYNEWFRLLKDDSYLFLFVGVKTIHYWITEGIKAGFIYKNIIATRSFNNGAKKAKNNFGFQFQPILLFSKGVGKAFNDVDLIPTSLEWYNDKRNKNPKKYTYEYPNWIKTEWAFASEKRANNSIHPNEKNVKLLEFLIGVLSNKNDVVLDPFMGSGTTGLACQNIERDFIGIELNPKYFNICQNRLNLF